MDALAPTEVQLAPVTSRNCCARRKIRAAFSLTAMEPLETKDECRMTRTFARTLLGVTLPALVLCFGCTRISTKPADAPTTSNASHAGTAMSDKAQPSPSSAGLQAQLPDEVERKLLKLIESIQKPQDLTLGRFRSMFSPAETTGQNGAEDSGFYEEVPGTDWTHSLSFSDASGSGTASIEYRLDHPNLHSDALKADFGKVCGLDFDAYRKELLSMGYLEGPPTPDPTGYENRGALSHTFNRPGVVVDILSVRENGAHGSAHPRMCIQKIEISATAEAATEGK